ncbi:MAG: hypothetical protein LUD78_08540 [Clostridiales bacterium]|nr:hypothetical protein [Clostridiales bacterium]
MVTVGSSTPPYSSSSAAASCRRSGQRAVPRHNTWGSRALRAAVSAFSGVTSRSAQ